MFVVDINGFGEGMEAKPAHTNLEDLINEVMLYDESLLQRPIMIFANKWDEKEISRAHEKQFGDLIKRLDAPFFKGR